MVNPPKKDPGAWFLILCGSALLWFAYPQFVVYLQTGYAFRRHSVNFPHNLFGGDAAAIDGIYLLAGVFLLAAGLRKLLFGK
ncbi:hypothetical protein [Novilysobacter longmucuonensis]